MRSSPAPPWAKKLPPAALGLVPDRVADPVWALAAEHVVAVGEPVVAVASIEAIVTVPADEGVVARPAVEFVVAEAFPERVVAPPAYEQVVAGQAFYVVVVGPAGDRVGLGRALEVVVFRGAINRRGQHRPARQRHEQRRHHHHRCDLSHACSRHLAGLGNIGSEPRPIYAALPIRGDDAPIGHLVIADNRTVYRPSGSPAAKPRVGASPRSEY